MAKVRLTQNLSLTLLKRFISLALAALLCFQAAAPAYAQFLQSSTTRQAEQQLTTALESARSAAVDKRQNAAAVGALALAMRYGYIGWDKTGYERAGQFRGFGRRADGSAMATGFFGEIVLTGGAHRGKVITEAAIRLDYDGKQYEVPLLNPLMSANDIMQLRAGQLSEAMIAKAQKWLIARIASRKTPFAQGDEIAPKHRWHYNDLQNTLPLKAGLSIMAMTEQANPFERGTQEWEAYAQLATNYREEREDAADYLAQNPSQTADDWRAHRRILQEELINPAAQEAAQQSAAAAVSLINKVRAQKLTEEETTLINQQALQREVSKRVDTRFEEYLQNSEHNISSGPFWASRGKRLGYAFRFVKNNSVTGKLLMGGVALAQEPSAMPLMLSGLVSGNAAARKAGWRMLSNNYEEHYQRNAQKMGYHDLGTKWNFVEDVSLTALSFSADYGVFKALGAASGAATGAAIPANLARSATTAGRVARALAPSMQTGILLASYEGINTFATELARPGDEMDWKSIAYNTGRGAFNGALIGQFGRLSRTLAQRPALGQGVGGRAASVGLGVAEGAAFSLAGNTYDWGMGNLGSRYGNAQAFQQMTLAGLTKDALKFYLAIKLPGQIREYSAAQAQLQQRAQTALAEHTRALGLVGIPTQEEVRTAYRRMAADNHPDRNPPGITEADAAARLNRYHAAINARDFFSAYFANNAARAAQTEQPAQPRAQQQTLLPMAARQTNAYQNPFVGPTLRGAPLINRQGALAGINTGSATIDKNRFLSPGSLFIPSLHVRNFVKTALRELYVNDHPTFERIMQPSPNYERVTRALGARPVQLFSARQPERVKLDFEPTIDAVQGDLFAPPPAPATARRAFGIDDYIKRGHRREAQDIIKTAINQSYEQYRLHHLLQDEFLTREEADNYFLARVEENIKPAIDKLRPILVDPAEAQDLLRQITLSVRSQNAVDFGDFSPFGDNLNRARKATFALNVEKNNDVLGFGTSWLMEFMGGRYLFTNRHVIEDADKIEVYHNKKFYEAEVLYTLPGDEYSLHRDAALLRVKDPAFAAGVEPLQISVAHPQRGDDVLGIGYFTPINISQALHNPPRRRTAAGKILGFDFNDGLITTEPFTTSGMSGGPAIRPDGKVIGANSLGYFTNSKEPASLYNPVEKPTFTVAGGAVPGSQIHDFMKRAVSHLYFNRPLDLLQAMDGDWRNFTRLGRAVNRMAANKEQEQTPAALNHLPLLPRAPRYEVSIRQLPAQLPAPNQELFKPYTQTNTIMNTVWMMLHRAGQNYNRHIQNRDPFEDTFNANARELRVYMARAVNQGVGDLFARVKSPAAYKKVKDTLLEAITQISLKPSAQDADAPNFEAFREAYLNRVLSTLLRPVAPAAPRLQMELFSAPGRVGGDPDGDVHIGGQVTKVLRAQDGEARVALLTLGGDNPFGKEGEQIILKSEVNRNYATPQTRALNYFKEYEVLQELSKMDYREFKNITFQTPKLLGRLDAGALSQDDFSPDAQQLGDYSNSAPMIAMSYVPVDSGVSLHQILSGRKTPQEVTDNYLAGQPITQAEWGDIKDIFAMHHAAGIDHQDLAYGDNLTLRRDAQTGKLNVYLIDMEYSSFPHNGSAKYARDLAAVEKFMASGEQGLLQRPIPEPTKDRQPTMETFIKRLLGIDVDKLTDKMVN